MLKVLILLFIQAKQQVKTKLKAMKKVEEEKNRSKLSSSMFS